MKINEQDFEVYRTFLYKDSGLSITFEKAYLLESRLSPVIKKLGLDDLDALTSKIKMNDAGAKNEVIEAMTTNETFFFRDTHPFERFEKVVLPKVLENKAPGSTIRIWCAACSSGQEPYSLGILLKENAAKFAGYNFEIMATDLSDDILDIARAGRYSQFEVQRGMPITLLVKYFQQDGNNWLINDEIKSMVKFSKFNLLNSMATLGNFDVIFCRNVLIYFDAETKGKVLGEMQQHIAKHGSLFLGGAETVVGITDKFKPLPGERGLYVPHDSVLL
jgi:chemotaxis protein methyltransferase CheR